MNTFIYDFRNGTTITNPLEGVTHFYASPNEAPNVWTLMNLKDVVTDESLIQVVVKDHFAPVMVMPLAVLGLARCNVRINTDLSGGVIYTGRKSLYFRFTKDSSVICITSIC